MVDNIENRYTPTAASNITIDNFDDLTADGGNGQHDQVDLTAIFDALGGQYSDGSNDLQDREKAVLLSYGDFNGDGNEDIRIGIAGIPGFSVTLSDPASARTDGVQIGNGSGAYDDIAVMNTTSTGSHTVSANGATANDGDAALYDNALDSFSLNANHQIVINGTVDPYTTNVSELLVENGMIYQTAPDPATNGKTAGWWEYTPNSGWNNWTQVSEDPRDSDPTTSGTGNSGSSTTTTTTTTTTTPTITHAVSADGATATAGSGMLYDSALDAFAINANHQITINGVVDPNSANVTELLVEHGALYQTAPNPSTNGTTAAWWEYTPNSGWDNWTQVSGDPRTGATTTATTTSTTGSASSVSTGSTEHSSFSVLSNGVNVERSEFGVVTDTDLQSLKADGVQNIRIFLSPNEWAPSGGAMNPESNGNIQQAAEFMDRVIKAGMAVVISPFADASPNFLSNPNDTGSINQYVSWMKEFATFINSHYSAGQVFIETMNEPVLQTSAGSAADDKSWWNIQSQLISAVHSVNPNITVVATANMWDSASHVEQMTPYADKNVVYAVHYYQPMDFTHQGASWVPEYANEQNVSFTSSDAAQVQSDFSALHNWATANNAFVDIDEFGVMNTAPEASRVAWLSDIRTLANQDNFGWDVWDYDKAFSISTPDSNGNHIISDPILQALGWGPYDASDHVLIA